MTTGDQRQQVDDVALVHAEGADHRELPADETDQQQPCRPDANDNGAPARIERPQRHLDRYPSNKLEREINTASDVPTNYLSDIRFRLRIDSGRRQDRALARGLRLRTMATIKPAPIIRASIIAWVPRPPHPTTATASPTRAARAWRMEGRRDTIGDDGGLRNGRASGMRLRQIGAATYCASPPSLTFRTPLTLGKAIHGRAAEPARTADRRRERHALADDEFGHDAPSAAIT